jgi:hypothetical protein
MIAAVLLALLSLLTSALPLFVAVLIPAVVLYSGVALGFAGLAATGGLWMLKRWGLWLTIVTSAINFLWAAPGLAVVLTTPLWRSDPVVVTGFVLSLITVAAFVLVIALTVLPSSRRAYR